MIYILQIAGKNHFMTFEKILVGLTVIVILMSVALLPASLFADELSESEERKKQIETELEALQKKLIDNQKETNKQKQALRVVEIELGALYRSIQLLDQRVGQQEEAISVLEEEQATLQNRLDEKADEIKSILRLAYKQNNQPLIKLILSGSRPEDLSRHLYYFSMLTSNQQDVLGQWIEDQSHLRNSIAQHQITKNQLIGNQENLQKERKALESQKNKRSQVLANLSAQSRTVSESIEDKEIAREHLSILIEQMKEEIARLSLEFPEFDVIDDSKGQLNWPVAGRLKNRYGQRIDGSALRWQGIVISANEGAPVKAVHSGRIVFADFFKSNGLLVIIDHGQGIWTLYGRNRALLTEVGAWVNAGDIIAEVGQSGGYSESGLYFEVRNNGTPLNPASWLSKR